MKKILVILCHPDSNSFCGSITQAYVDSAKEAGAEVRQLKLGELKFDPVLWNGYNKIQELEPDLIKAQELVQWSEHLVFVLKGLFISFRAEDKISKFRFQNFIKKNFKVVYFI